jgi:ABC-type cobalamin/Fe3+-siderophores transport system ATPase subunit
MHLVAFRIQNFRSIIDTGRHQLAHDNITNLIGQNESGKTSILEALKAFHDGVLIEDMLRSNLSLPEVTCKFTFNFNDVENRINKRRLNPEVRKLISTLEFISLTRVWEDDMDSRMEMGDELQEIFNERSDQIKMRELKVMENLEQLNRDIATASKNLNKANDEVAWTNEKVGTVRNRMNELKRNLRKFSLRDKKHDLRKELEQEGEMFEKLKETFVQKKTKQEEKLDILEALEEKNSLSKRLGEIRDQTFEKKEKLLSAQEQLKQVLQMTGMFPNDREQRAAEIREEIFRTDIDVLKSEIAGLKEDHSVNLLGLEFVFEGMSIENAVKAARKELDSGKEFYSSDELAEEIFKILPDFEMFEDFSSLLPNRIDLEDIVKANRRAEGYKAAINFLTITGLEYSFFQQPSSRILKQKIENLNGELTLNFQDFWRQNVGKKQKIKINFELSHYDHTHPEKSGKPFIEFWIKDEHERLYPKQRSRGVRWFLSFFLELKASAMDKSQRNKVLLIDEPGVSLHARAQEDVLKVFDDIKERIQIIYTTHSPHLIDVNKLYRILAVQRAVEDDMKSETLVYSARSLKSATADTLSPIYSTMGARLSQQEIIKSFNNVIVKDLASYYFLKAIVALTGFEKECYFLPASGAESIPMMVNILIGWGIDYIILNFGNAEERTVHEQLRKEQYDNKIDLAKKQMMFMEEYQDTEDLFSTIDFKKYVVKVREGITVKNSEYLQDNNYSRAILASSFLQEVNSGNVIFKNLDDETRDNLNYFVQQLNAMLK